MEHFIRLTLGFDGSEVWLCVGDISAVLSDDSGNRCKSKVFMKSDTDPEDVWKVREPAAEVVGLIRDALTN